MWFCGDINWPAMAMNTVLIRWVSADVRNTTPLVDCLQALYVWSNAMQQTVLISWVLVLKSLWLNKPPFLNNYIIAGLNPFNIVELVHTYEFGYNSLCLLIVFPCRKFIDASCKTNTYYSWKTSLFPIIILKFIINVPENKCNRFKTYCIFCLDALNPISNIR